MSEVRNERPKKSRKDIIKDITIAFLAVLLLLTFFSNTIMNYSLPEVAIQQIQEGTISPVIRAEGTVEAKDPYSVKVSQERVIKSVAVEVGANVKKGDTLYYLEDKESTELQDARTKLEELMQTYEAALFSGDLSNEAINRIRGGQTLSMDQFQAKLKAATDRYDAAKLADEEAQAAIDEQSQNQAYTSAQYNYDEATPQYREAEITARITEIDIQLSNEEAEKSRLEPYLEETNNKTIKSKVGLKNSSEVQKWYWYHDSVIDALNEEKDQLNIEQANSTKDVSQVTTQAGQVDYDYQRKAATLQNIKNKTAQELDRASTDRSELLTEIAKEIELDSQRDNIAEQQETVEKLEKEAIGATVVAPVDGTVTELFLKAGETTNAENPVATIQIDGKGMQMSCSIPMDQAKRIKVGDIAEPTNSWYYTDFKASVKSITADTNNPNTKKTVTFSIESTEVQNGQSVKLQIGSKSDTYDLTIPAGAVREDTNGKFVLIVRAKSSPLGNRYIAARVDVEVLASDDTTAAISGSFEGDEYVITTSTALIKSGDQVRLANNS